MKKPTKAGTRYQPSSPFPRKSPPIPGQVRDAAGLWLEMFMGFIGVLVDPEQSGLDPLVAHRARVLADQALAEYENRWPGVRP